MPRREVRSITLWATGDGVGVYPMVAIKRGGTTRIHYQVREASLRRLAMWVRGWWTRRETPIGHTDVYHDGWQWVADDRRVW